MQAAIGTATAGLGVTLASTFAPSLGLSTHQQRIGFAVGVLLIVIGALLFAQGKRTIRDRKVRRQTPPAFDVGHLGKGKFSDTKSKGASILRADTVDTLEGDAVEHETPESEEDKDGGSR